MNLANLNINSGGKPVAGFVGDDAAFVELERLTGGKLPAAYVDLIRYADGGHPEVGCFYVPGGHPNNFFEVDQFYSIGNPSFETVKSALRRFGDLLGPDALPFGRDGGGNQFFLSMSSQPPAVWLCLADEDGKRVKLADSMELFLTGLASNPDFI
jgi:hypothetical protein